MPTNRKRRTRSRKRSIDDWRTEYLKIGKKRKDISLFAYMAWSTSNAHDTWNECKEMILSEWIAEHPGTRPYAWWLFDAPEMPEEDREKFDLTYSRATDPRKKLKGSGTPNYEVLNYGQSLHFGVPTSFVDKFDCDYYNGRAKDSNGVPIGKEYTEGDFVAEAYDPDKPPVYETEVAYLKRHGILTTEEKKKLKSGAISQKPYTVKITDVQLSTQPGD